MEPAYGKTRIRIVITNKTTVRKALLAIEPTARSLAPESTERSA